MPLGMIEIDIPPPLTIKAAATLKQLISDGLKDHQSVQIRLPQDEVADLSFIQLMMSAKLYAEQNNKEICLTSPASREILALVEAAGFDAKTQQFWLGYGE